MNFQPYPFERLNLLISDISPKKEVFKLTIGEPKFQTPKIITDALESNSFALRFYPASKGEDFLREAMLGFIRDRFGVKLESKHIIPTFGTREVLFNLPQFLNAYIKEKKNKQQITIAHPNPFYQIYEGAAIASSAKTIYMNLTKENNFKPSLTKEEMKEVDIVILNTPNNPTGSTLSLEELRFWRDCAIEYDFIILSDECYSEIYEDTKPASILQTNENLKNIIALNSISKRSSAPGLRSGFVAGDSEILKAYSVYRTYAGLALSLPLQYAAAAAWNDRIECEKIRKIYAENLKLAREIFNTSNIFPYSFYVWLFVKDDLDFTKKLYEDEGILVLPGSFLGRENGGAGFVRIALVYEDMKDVLMRLKNFHKAYLESNQVKPLNESKIHFIGIGGIGISGLAKYLKAQGATISGSDIAHSPTTHYLRSLGVEITIPHNKSAIKDQDLVIHSAIIKNDNEEIKEAKLKGIKTLSRLEALGLILDSKRVLSVCGAHGKSSISAMLSSIFNDYGAIIGAESKEFHSNVREKMSESIVFEADESDKSFLNSNPFIAIVPNAEPEHMETYNHDIKEFYKAYEDFLKLAKIRVINTDDKFLGNLNLDSIKLNPKTDIKNIKYILKNDEPYTHFNLFSNNENLGEFSVWGIGEHTALNASMAILAALSIKSLDSSNKEQNLKEIRENLANFCGIKKRFDILSKNPLTIIDDYAHHPTEIKATLNALKVYADLRKINLEDIYIIFQPHKYSRLFDNLEAFKKCFYGFKNLIILPVYRAGEEIREVDLYDLFKQYNPILATRVELNANKLEIYNENNCLKVLDSGLVIGFGAGDITYQLRGIK